MHLYMILQHGATHRVRTLVIDSDEVRRRENGNQDSILRRARRRDEFLCNVRNPPDGIPSVRRYTHREESTFNKRALRRGGAQIYV